EPRGFFEKETFTCAGFWKTSYLPPVVRLWSAKVETGYRPSSPRGRAATATARGCGRLQACPFRPTVAGRGGGGKMAASEKIMFPEKLSHKKYRAALKKEKRKKRRQELARLRDSGLSQKEEEETAADAFIEEQRREEERLLERE
ncbi:hypothetical protein EI555_015828, partial [Monodon monoceros]